jgi:hypothetical protein
MVFDEYITKDWPGETKAVDEVLGSDVRLHSVLFTRQPTANLVR